MSKIADPIVTRLENMKKYLWNLVYLLLELSIEQKIAAWIPQTHDGARHLT